MKTTFVTLAFLLMLISACHKEEQIVLIPGKQYSIRGDIFNKGAYQPKAPVTLTDLYTGPIISLKQYSHVLIFKVEGEPDATMSLTRRTDNEPLAGVITQAGYEPHLFGYSGPIKIPALVEMLRLYHALRLEVPTETCPHDYDFAPEYYGNCPQPKR